jgi:hypothetical protein
MSFFREIRRLEGLVSFRLALSELAGEHQHIILCFASDQMRWCFLSSPRRFCPHCAVSWHWQHFLTCPHLANVLSSRNISLAKMRCSIRESSWSIVFSDIAHVLLVWSFALNSDPNFTLSYDVDNFRSLFLHCASWKWWDVGVCSGWPLWATCSFWKPPWGRFCQTVQYVLCVNTTGPEPLERELKLYNEAIAVDEFPF